MLEKERSAQLVHEYEHRLEMERNQEPKQSPFDVSHDDRSELSAQQRHLLDTSSDARSYLESAVSKRDQDKIAARERVKAKFRERNLKSQTEQNSIRAPAKSQSSRSSNTQQPIPYEQNKGRNGEESLYNHIEFYEKALNAVKS